MLQLFSGLLFLKLECVLLLQLDGSFLLSLASRCSLVIGQLIKPLLLSLQIFIFLLLNALSFYSGESLSLSRRLLILSHLAGDLLLLGDFLEPCCLLFNFFLPLLVGDSDLFSYASLFSDPLLLSQASLLGSPSLIFNPALLFLLFLFCKLLFKLASNLSLILLLGDLDGDLELFLHDLRRGILVHTLELTGRTFEVLTLYKCACSCKNALVLFILEVALSGF